MVGQEYDEMTARYFSATEEYSREQLAEASGLIAKFTTLAASNGMITAP